MVDGRGEKGKGRSRMAVMPQRHGPPKSPCQ
jgi:hypothetical protein